MESKTNLYKRYFGNSKYALLFSFVSFLFLFGPAVLAQEGTATVSQMTNILINRNIMQTIQILDENASPVSDTQVTATVDNIEIVELSLLGPAQSVDANSSSLTATTDSNGLISLIIKGISQGEAAITFSADDTLAVPAQQLDINVIGVEASFSVSGQTFGSSPLDLTFNDTSTGANIVSRKWDFGDGSSPEIDVISAPHTFNAQGLHNVTLEITAQSNIGEVKDATSTAICVFPQSGPIVEGVGTVHGVVWFEQADSEGTTVRFPLRRAIVTLVGQETLTEITDIRGIFNFGTVTTGNYSAFACKGGVCDKEEGDLIINDGDDKNLEFVIRK